MNDRFNTAAGWVLFSGIVALGLAILSGKFFHADGHEELETPGYVIEAGEEGGGEAAGPDLGTLLATGDPAAGEKIFAKCTACHTVDQGGANGIGPNLFGVMGKPIGKHVAGFAYSSALSDHGGDWTWENLDAWLASPRGFANGTKMSFAGLSKPEDRANVMLFLESKGGAPAKPAPAAAEEAGAESASADEGATESEAAAEAVAEQDAAAQTEEAGA
ncbi:c-type cytochrome [Altererythrobacter sp.]|uniref:c-type cytochrome n=1 Tax=Altererythrobacter sp. TaxID=1872480 RepID=UPI003D0D4055